MTSDSQSEGGGVVSSTALLDLLVEDGWTPASEPPDTDRAVQVAWDDGSTSENALCFYDSKSIIPPDGKKYWWTHPKMNLLSDGDVIAWRERSNKY